MSSYTIWHNPKCSTSRFVLDALREAGLDPVVRDYQKEPPREAELREALTVLGMDARGLIRNKNSLYRELDLDNPNRSEDELIAAMAENPVLIERPVVFGSNNAKLCRPKETVFEIIYTTN